MSDWQLPILILTPVLGISFVACIWHAVWARRNHTPYNDLNFISWFSIAGAILTGALLALVWFPYDTDYLKWTEVSGEVERVESRLVSNSDGMEEKFVVEIDGQPYGCEDTRCATADPGDTITLKCHKSWQWASTHGWDCRFIALDNRK